jgi:uncharacterized membrane protein YfcA
MSYVIICTVALVVSGLTLFSGFGLGTLLMPAFALFFPVQVAVAATAIVHLVNNIFKVVLVGRNADLKIVLKFALPAALAAMLGALALNLLANIPPLTEYAIGGRTCVITPVKLVIAALILVFAVLEFIPSFERLSFDPKYIPIGGILSGFFGGLSGHQGALRTAFLIRVGLQKEVFIGTMVVSAVVVDVSRLIVYGITFFARNFAILTEGGGIGLVVWGSLAAFLGAFIGSRLLKKITMRAIQSTVGVMLFGLSITLATGLV